MRFELLQELAAFSDHVSMVEFSPDGRWIALASLDGRGLAVNSAADRVDLTTHAMGVLCGEWSPSGVLATGGQDG